jgi:leucine dehydrogenase
MAPAGAPQKSEAYLASYAQALKKLGEPFFTGEDVGITEQDIEVLCRYHDDIIGRPDRGNFPAEWAALSVYESIKVALEERFGSDSLGGRTVAVKGVGNVGLSLCKKLQTAGATLVIADINEQAIARAREHLPDVRVVSSERIHAEAVDVYAPCALGNEFTEVTVAELSCGIVCGAANNQLASAEQGRALFERGILYVPDYAANAGGLINVVDELEEGGYRTQRVQERVERLRDTIREIIKRSIELSKPTSDIADTLAEHRFKQTK